MIKVTFDKKCGKWSIDRNTHNFGFAASLQAAVSVAMEIAMMNPQESLKVLLPSFPLHKTVRKSLPIREYRSWQDDINRYEDELNKMLSAEQVLKEYQEQKVNNDVESSSNN